MQATDEATCFEELEGVRWAMSEAAAEAMYPRIVSQLRGRIFTAAELGGLTGVSERQVQRWSAGASKPEGPSRAKLLELKYVVDQLREVYTEEGVEIWLHGRNRGLDGQRPIDLLSEGEIDPVLQAVERLRVGAM